MIDKIKFYIKDVDIDTLEKKLRKGGGLDIVGIDWRSSVSKYGCYLKDSNIFIKINGKTNKLEGHGSLHKYAKGNNFSVFTAQEAIDSIAEIGELMGISLNRFIITCLEIGVNIPMPKEPMVYINTILSYGTRKKRPFIYMRPLKKSSQLRGRLCQFTEYTIKFYDKTFEVRHPMSNEERALVPSNILRYEVELHPKQYYMIGFKNIKASTLTAEKLLNSRFYGRFIRILKQVLEKTELRDLDNIHKKKSLDDIKRYIFATSGSYILFLNYLKEHHDKKDYNKANKDKRSLEKEFEFVNTTENIIELKSKFAEVIELVSYKRTPTE